MKWSTGVEAHDWEAVAKKDNLNIIQVGRAGGVGWGSGWREGKGRAAGWVGGWVHGCEAVGKKDKLNVIQEGRASSLPHTSASPPQAAHASHPSFLFAWR